MYLLLAMLEENMKEIFCLSFIVTFFLYYFFLNVDWHNNILLKDPFESTYVEMPSLLYNFIFGQDLWPLISEWSLLLHISCETTFNKQGEHWIDWLCRIANSAAIYRRQLTLDPFYRLIKWSALLYSLIK